jgi:predicted metal-binding protein
MADKPSIAPVVNGPYLVKNLKDFMNSKGEAVEIQTVMELCSCGRSLSVGILKSR